MDEFENTNPMMEIAFACGGAVFVLFVIAMVFFSDISSPEGPSDTAEQKLNVIALMLIPAANEASETVVEVSDQDVFLAFDGKRFFDQNLKPVEVSQVPKEKRIIIGVVPDFQAAMTARQAVSRSDVIITELSQAWVDRLQAEGR